MDIVCRIGTVSATEGDSRGWEEEMGVLTLDALGFGFVLAVCRFNSMVIPVTTSLLPSLTLVRPRLTYFLFTAF